MPSPDMIVLSDRIKELSHSTGVDDFTLDGAVTGFSSFGDYYSSGDAVYYAVTDGTDYEVGSGVYTNDTVTSRLVRFPFRSTNSDAAVSFVDGVKEVYITYPADYSVYTTPGMGGFQQPQNSGLAFWGGSQVLNYDQNIVWDKEGNNLGIHQASPGYAIDVGGLEAYSQVRASGFIVGDSGILFSGVNPSYSGGRQLEPFVRNQILNTATGVLALSGHVSQHIYLKKAQAGNVLAGPPSGDCVGGCDENYPTLRGLVAGDIPDLSDYYLIQKDDTPNQSAIQSGIAFFHRSGILDRDEYFVWDSYNNFLGINKKTPTVELDVDGDTKITGTVYIGGDIKVTGNVDIQGDVTYIDSSNVTIWDKQIELASMSGTAQYNDLNVDDGGLVIKSTQGDKKWTWRDSTDAWTTDEKLDVSGIIFNDLSVISGAYRAGSGLSLHDGIEFNVGNMFDVSANDANVLNIHQGDQISISGVSGVSVYSSVDSSLTTFTIDPSELSGILDGKISASGMAISGWADGTIVGTGTALANDIGQSGMSVSGWAAYDIDKLYTSGNVVSGWAWGNIDKLYTSGNAISGWAWTNIDKLYTSGNAISGWADGTIVGTGTALANDIGQSGMSVSGWANGAIVNTGVALANDIGESGMSVSGWAWGNIDKLYTSGNAISGWAWGNIDKLYTSGNAISGWAWTNIDKLYTSGNAISGWAWGNIDKLYTSGNAISGWAWTNIDKLYTSGNAISGWAREYIDNQVYLSNTTAFTHWTIKDQLDIVENIESSDTVKFNGISGVYTNYNTTTNTMEISAHPLSGWTWNHLDKLYTSGNAISGWANATIIGTGTALANDIGESGMAVSGWAWGTIANLIDSAPATLDTLNELAAAVGDDADFFNTMTGSIGASGMSVSGWADGTIVNTGVALANDIGESGMSVSGWAAYDIDKLYTSGNAVSGWAWGNIDKLYTSGNAISGWAWTNIDKLYTSGNAISGWADGTIVNTGVALANDIGESGMSVSGWANGTIVNTGVALANDIGESGMSVSGWAWGNIDKLYTSGNAISGWADGNLSGISDRIVSTGTILANDIGESGMSVSGWAWGNIDKLYTSGNAISGWAWGTIANLIDSAPATLDTLNELAAAIGDDANFLTTVAGDVGASGMSVSGWAQGNSNNIDNKIDASGALISGWAVDYANAKIVAIGAFTHFHLQSYNAESDNFIDFEIGDHEDIIVSGISGIDTYLKQDADSNNVLEISAHPLSGWMQGTLDGGVSYSNWTIDDGGGHSDNIREHTVVVSGLSGVDTYYNPSNNTMEVNAGSLSGWAAYDIDQLYASGNTVSGWANSQINRLDTKIDGSGSMVSGWAWGNIDKLYTSGNAISGWAWGNIDKLYASGNTISGWANSQINRLDTKIDGSGSMVSGWAWGNIDKLYTSGNAISGFFENTRNTAGSGLELVGYELNTAGTGNFDAVQIGSGNYNIVKVGSEIVGEYNSDFANLIGYRAGSASRHQANTNAIGYLAGSGAVGTTAATGRNNFIGAYAGLGSSGDTNSCLGVGAGSQSDISDSVAIGYATLANSKNIDQSTVAGHIAAWNAKGILQSDIMGYQAGWQASGIAWSTLAGPNAGYLAKDISTSVFLGYGAGARTFDISSDVSIGLSCGAWASGTNQLVALGDNCAYGMSGIDRSIAIGWEAGKQAGSRDDIHSTDNIFIGPRAGQDVRTSNNLFIITGTGNEDRWLESEWSDGAKDHGFQIGNTFTGKSDDGCYRIGATGTLAETQEATLSIKPTTSSTPGLQLLPGVSQSAGLLISDAISMNRSAGWEQKGDDIALDPTVSFGGGGSVSSSSDGNVVAIGAGVDDGQSTSSGYVRVYAWNGSAWVQRGADIDGESAGDMSGYSVSLSSDGTIVAIGAYNNDSDGINKGHVRVYQYDADKDAEVTDQTASDFGPIGWNRLGADIDGEINRDQSGFSVSLSDDGTIVAIGAIENDPSRDGTALTDAGHVRVYQYDADKDAEVTDQTASDFGPIGWNRLGGDIDGEGGGDLSGYSVSLSSDGSIVAIGARYNDGGSHNSGHVRVYQYDADKDAEVTDQTASDFGPVGWNRLGADIDGEDTGGMSGQSVSLSDDGTIVAIGVYTNTPGYQTNAGHVRVYQYDANKDTAVTDQTLPNFGPIGWNRLGADIDGEAADDHSGQSVSLSSDGSIVAIGSAWNDDGGTNAGHVRVYEYKTITEDEYNSGNTNQYAYGNDDTTGAIGVPVIITGGESWGASTKFWVQQGDDIDGEAADEKIGLNVSLSSDGNSVVVGGSYSEAWDAVDGDQSPVRVYQASTSFVDSSIVNNNGLLIAADRSRSQVFASTNKGSLILDSTLSTPRLYYSNGTDWASFQDQTNILDYISTVTPAADKFVYFDSSSTAATGTVTSFMRDLLASGDQSGAQVHLGVDPIGTVGASGMAISGWADSTIIGTGNALINKIDASGTAVSGWTQGSFGSFLVNNNDDTIGGTLSADGYIVANNGYIGSVTTTDAIQLASNGAVTVKKAIKEAIDSPGVDGTTYTLDMDVANFHTIDLTASQSRTIAVDNVALGQRFVLRLKQPSYTGNGTVNWGFSNINWCDGTPPTIGSTANHITLIGFVKVEGHATDTQSSDKYDGILIAADLY